MKKIILPLLSFVIIPLILNAQNFEWAASYGGSSFDEPNAIAVDANGNIYTIGDFQGIIDFDPSASSMSLTSSGLTDGFIQKIDANGNFLWVKQIGGTSAEQLNSIHIDSNGGLLLTGRFDGTVDFDPGVGTSTMTAVGGVNPFILKLDNNGDFLWAKQMEGISPLASGTGTNITEDQLGDIYVVGTFTDTIDIDPGVDSIALISNGGSNVFIQKLNANGEFIWGKSFGGTLTDVVADIETDLNHNLLLTGYFYDTVDFDPGVNTVNLISNGQGDVFTMKLDSSGNYLWVVAMGSSSFDAATDLYVNNIGDIFVTGEYRLTVDFDPSASTFNLSSNGGAEIFIQKLSNNGDFVWTKSIGGTGFDSGGGISGDIDGDLYLTGRYQDTVDFDPSGASLNLVSNGSYDMYIAKFDTSGNFLWAESIGGSDSDQGSFITNDNVGNIWVSGFFGDSADFDPSSGTSILTDNGNGDIFIAKYSQVGVAISEIEGDLNAKLYPNPNLGQFRVEFHEKQKECDVTVLSLDGRIILQKHNLNNSVLDFDISILPAGIYILELRSTSQLQQLKFIKE